MTDEGSEAPHLDIAGSVAVVTGGANGIGRGIVRALLGRGATVVIADIEAPMLESTVAELASLGPVSGWQTDVTDEASVAALSEHVFSTHGHCDLLFLNAGVTGCRGSRSRTTGVGVSASTCSAWRSAPRCSCPA